MYLPGDTAEAAGTAGPASGPSAGLYLTEPARGLAGLAFLPLAAPWLAAAPRGDGHGVLVVPGFLATDTSTALLRRFMRRLGYDVRGWDLGRNRGPSEAVLDGLPRAPPARGRHAGAHARAGCPPDSCSVHGRVLAAGRHRVLADLRRAGNGAARERRGPLRAPRLRHRSRDAVADSRPARRPGRPVAPLPAATPAASLLPGPLRGDGRCSSSQGLTRRS